MTESVTPKSRFWHWRWVLALLVVMASSRLILPPYWQYHAITQLRDRGCIVLTDELPARWDWLTRWVRKDDLRASVCPIVAIIDSDGTLTDRDLMQIAWMTELQGLALNGNHVTRAGIDRLKHALPKCDIQGP